MSKVRRFRVTSLAHLAPGASLSLPETEAAHIRVLRLNAGDSIELFDDAGHLATATLGPGIGQVTLTSVQQTLLARNGRLILATAWPKGKRAALLVEKCSELGVNAILPVLYARSVVSKDDESEGLVRLRRIAAEAAKQSGRNDVPEILAEQTLEHALDSFVPQALCLLLDPRAERGLLDILMEHRVSLKSRPLMLLVGPEGGFAPAELESVDRRGLPRVRLARHILRVETAALAACAVAGAILD